MNLYGQCTYTVELKFYKWNNYIMIIYNSDITVVIKIKININLYLSESDPRDLEVQ